jgi:hypothetical protein
MRYVSWFGSSSAATECRGPILPLPSANCATQKNVALDRPAVDAASAILDAGGDFADGVIAYEGAWQGGEAFVSFDKKAVALHSRQGHKTR